MEDKNQVKVIDRRMEQKEVATIQRDPFLEMIERLASRPDIDPDKIEKFIKMQEGILDRNAEQSFNEAMMKAQSRIELVVAKSDNKQTKSKYADLKSILLKVKPIYTEEGFSLMFYEGDCQIKDHKRICVDVMHRDGHTKKRHGDFAVQTTGIQGSAMMTLIHGQGSAISYGRRYLTCMIFNIPTGDDDDGNSAGQEPEYITEKQLSTILDMMNKKEINQTKFCKYMKVETPEYILAKDYNKAITAIKAQK